MIDYRDYDNVFYDGDNYDVNWIANVNVNMSVGGIVNLTVDGSLNASANVMSLLTYYFNNIKIF